MQQVKIFHGLENDIAALEQSVNDWLKSSGAKVVTVFGNIAPQTPRSNLAATPVLGAERSTARTFVASDVLMVVVYET